MRRSTALLLVLVTGCTARATYHGRPHVSSEIEHRTGHAILADSASPSAPDGMSLDDGITQDEAVALALWNNAAFQEALAELGFTRAELVQAGLLTNPVFSVLFPLGPKQLEFTATFPLEALWLRPRRLEIAAVESERVAERLVQSGLDLVRDVKIAYTEVHRATERARLAEQNVLLFGRIAEIAEARLRAGETTELESHTARIEVLRAKEDSARLSYDVVLAKQRLGALLGRAYIPGAFQLNESPELASPDVELVVLLHDALAARPELRAAELAIDAACRRADLAHVDYLLVAGMLDANGRGTKGFEAGPGLLVTLPIFNHNDGAVAKAEAEITRSVRQLETVGDRIELEVRTSFTRYMQAKEQLDTWRADVLPRSEETVRLAQKSFEDGDASLVLVLETTRQLLDARVREVESDAAMRRAWAELEHSVGRRLGGEPPGETVARLSRAGTATPLFPALESQATVPAAPGTQWETTP